MDIFYSIFQLQQNNNFYTRPPNLVTKDFFSPVQRKESTSSNKSFRRPIKLPLRKHHSFHFQPPQAVAGIIKLKRQPKHGQEDHLPSAASSSNIHAKHKTVGEDDKLVFKPYDENSAFQPIQPIRSTLNQSLPNTSVLDSECNTINRSSNNNSNDAKSISSSSSGSDKTRYMPKTSALTIKKPLQESVSDNDTVITAKRLVYADLLDTSREISDTDNRKVNCIPKPSRTQYATIQFPEVNI